MAAPPEYRPRLADARLKDLLGSFAAVMINGPRATGKTTTAAQLAAEVVRLDQPAQAAVFRADPDAALRSFAQPLLLDEWQEAPEVLGAEKRAVDTDRRPGRFLLYRPPASRATLCRHAFHEAVLAIPHSPSL